LDQEITDKQKENEGLCKALIEFETKNEELKDQVLRKENIILKIRKDVIFILA